MLILKDVRVYVDIDAEISEDALEDLEKEFSDIYELEYDDGRITFYLRSPAAPDDIEYELEAVAEVVHEIEQYLNEKGLN